MSNAPESPSESPREKSGDASRGEVAIYAFGNVEGAIADRFPETLQNILIVVSHFNPILLGLIMGVRMFWDGVMDPIMAHISDNTKTRWGRRRPFILVGGVARCLFLIPFIALLPLGDRVTDNQLMEAQRFTQEAAQTIDAHFDTLIKAERELPGGDNATRAKILDVMEGRPPRSWITRLIGFFTPEQDKSYPVVIQQQLDRLNENLPTLTTDLEKRRALLMARREALGALQSQKDSDTWKEAYGLTKAAEDSVETAETLITRGRQAQATGQAALVATRYLMGRYGDQPTDGLADSTQAQVTANEVLRAHGFEPVILFPPEPVVEAVPASSVPEDASWLDILHSAASKARDGFVGLFRMDSLREGFDAFLSPANYQQRTLAIYLLVAYLIFATLATVNSAPYYALGIELSPSYEGRTQVVVYRSVMNQVMGLVAPWVPVFCFSLYFHTAYDALFWVAVFACVIGVPSTVLMFFKTRERTHAVVKKAGERPNLFRSMWEIAREREFLRILFLFVFIGLVNGLFQQIGFFLNVYWVTGSALSGATLGAQVSMLAWALGLISLPLIKWACDRFQKHRVLQFSILWMAIGTAMKWWLMNPEHPEYQFILPFFFSVGIGAVYNVLPAMMADVTDLDELRYGLRREGMFGAVMGFLMKLIGTITPIAAGVVLVLSGFDAELEYRQAPQTITNMRLMFSLVPAVMLLLALFAVRRYPLTRERVHAIKAELAARREDGP